MKLRKYLIIPFLKAVIGTVMSVNHFNKENQNKYIYLIANRKNMQEHLSYLLMAVTFKEENLTRHL
jgi:hypothetical protein